MTEKEQKELQENLDSLENGTAQMVTNQEVKDRVKLFFDNKKHNLLKEHKDKWGKLCE